MWKCLTDFKDDPDLYVFPHLKYVAVELWQVSLPSHNCILSTDKYLALNLFILMSALMFQVKTGTLFDNILICDDPEYAKKFAGETWGTHKDVCCGFCPNCNC